MAFLPLDVAQESIDRFCGLQNDDSDESSGGAIYIFVYRNMRNAFLKSLREEWKDVARIYMVCSVISEPRKFSQALEEGVKRRYTYASVSGHKRRVFFFFNSLFSPA